jgi:hypothetical protein
MSSLQQRLAAVTDMLAAIAAIAVSLKSQLSELDGLRERVREASEIAGRKTRSITATIQGPTWKAGYQTACGPCLET